MSNILGQVLSSLFALVLSLQGAVGGLSYDFQNAYLNHPAVLGESTETYGIGNPDVFKPGQKVNLTGKLEVYHVDDFLKKQPGKLYLLRDDSTGKRYQINPAQGKALGKAASGDAVSVEGTVATDPTVIDNADWQAFSPGSTPVPNQWTDKIPAQSGVQNTAIFMVNSQSNSSYQPFTAQQILDNFGVVLDNYYKEASYGKVSLNPRVYGYFSIPAADICNFNAIINDTDSLAKASGVDFSQIKKIIYAPVGCGGGGLGGTSSDGIGRVLSGLGYYNNPFLNIRTAIHEMGHAFVLPHAPAMDCLDTAMGACPISDTGDYTDVMSYFMSNTASGQIQGLNGSGHFNPFYKEQLGWLDSFYLARVQTVTQSGTYALAPYETGNANMPLALKIYKDTDVFGNKVWYYVIFRQPIGFDSFMDNRAGNWSWPEITQGVEIYMGIEGGSFGALNFSGDKADIGYIPYPNSVDLSYERTLSFGPAQQLADKNSGLTIRLLSAGPSGASVQVAYGAVPALPTVSFTNPVQSKNVVQPGSVVNLAASAGSVESAIASVDFTLNGAVLCHDTAAPYTCNWTVPAGVNQLYYIQAVAKDARGLASNPAKILLSTDSVAPGVVVMGVTNGQTVVPGKQISMSVKPANADAQGCNTDLEYSEVWMNGQLVNRQYNRCGNYFDWTVPSYITNATYNFTVKGFDKSGNSSTTSVSMTAGSGGTPAFSGPVAAPTENYPTDQSTWAPYSILAGYASFANLNISTPQTDKTARGFSYLNGRDCGDGITYCSAMLILTSPLGSTLQHQIKFADISGTVGPALTTTLKIAKPSSDSQAPTVPVSPKATTVSSSQINLSWTASTDNVGVAGYNIYRNGTKIGATASASYSDTGLSANTTYSYGISAFDAAGNTSAQSTAVSATTLPSTPPSVNKFNVGDRVHTTSKLKVRQTPSNSGKALCTQPKNAYGSIIGGPQTAGGYIWYQVNYDSLCDGWSVQDWLVK